MSATILPFKKPIGSTRQSAPERKKTASEIFQDVHEDVIPEWQRFASKNQLNEYVASKIPSHAKGASSADYVNDLNTISMVEQKLNMQVAVFYPGCTPNNPYGWLVAFHHGKEIFSTPPDMLSEANARALNIVLFMTLSYHLGTL